MDKHNGVTKEMMTMMITVKKVAWMNEKHGKNEWMNEWMNEWKTWKKSFSPQCFTDMNKIEALG